jgi:hypothetical protein
VLFFVATVDRLTRSVAFHHDRSCATAAIPSELSRRITSTEGTVVALSIAMNLQAMAPTFANAVQVNDLSARIRGEYREMPGLRLTISQASKLWNVDRDLCIRALESLTQAGYLYRSGEAYLKRGES